MACCLLRFWVKRNGSYEIELRFKELHLKMTSSIQGELMNVNATEVKEDDIQSKIFNSLLNNPCTDDACQEWRYH